MVCKMFWQILQDTLYDSLPPIWKSLHKIPLRIYRSKVKKHLLSVPMPTCAPDGAYCVDVDCSLFSSSAKVTSGISANRGFI